MENIDLGAARKAVCAWLDEHQGGTLAQMADELKHRYPDYPEQMAVVLRGMMAAELRRRTNRVQPFPQPEHRGDQPAGTFASPRRRAIAPT